MGRILITLATVLSILFGTGSMNIACLCAPGAVFSQTEAVGIECHGEQGDIDAGGSCCCCADDQDPAAPADLQSPGKSEPRPCPCLYWTAVPLATPETSTGPTLVKRVVELPPVLLLEAAPAPVACEAAAIFRDRPHGPRVSPTRLQAWLCVWTT